jgi:hypothetical protein
MGDGMLQSHSGANLNPKMAKDRGNVSKGGEAGGVALTAAVILQQLLLFTSPGYTGMLLRPGSRRARLQHRSQGPDRRAWLQPRRLRPLGLLCPLGSG